MNFYKRYIGDYMRDTAHLTMVEDGAYNRLLDHYYATHAALPAEYEALYRIARAFTKDEQQAVRSIADTFFVVGDDGKRHNNRADIEISKHAKQADVNREIGRRGGRPKKTESITESVSEIKPNGFRSNNRIGSENKTESITESVQFTKPNRNPNHSQNQNQKNQSQNLGLDGQPPDGGSTVWDFGKTILVEQGLSLKSAGALIGSWIKDYDESTVADALRSAAGKADIKAYVIGILRKQPKRKVVIPDPVLTKIRERYPDTVPDGRGYYDPGTQMRFDSRGEMVVV